MLLCAYAETSAKRMERMSCGAKCARMYVEGRIRGGLRAI